MTIDAGLKPEGAPERSPIAGAGAYEILGICGRRAGDGSEHAASLVCVSRRSRARAEPIDPRIAPR